MALTENIVETKFRVVLQPKSKCLFIRGVKFDYLAVMGDKLAVWA